jgi:hypothetical protein
MILRVVRDWRLLASIAAVVALVILLMRGRRGHGADRLAAAIEELLGAHRLPGETLLECASRVGAPSSVRALIWRLYQLHFDAAGTDTARDLARAIRILRRAQATESIPPEQA